MHLTTQPRPDRQRVRELNDEFRRTLGGGHVMLTPGVYALPIKTKRKLLRIVRSFDAFDARNDPLGEHNFMAIEAEDHCFIAKIDYYDRDTGERAAEPSDPMQTVRVMTIMLASEQSSRP